MDTTKVRNTGLPDYPENTLMNPPATDRRRAVWVLLAAVAAAIVLGVVLSLSGPSEDPYLPESRNATGAQAPAVAVPPARAPASR